MSGHLELLNDPQSLNDYAYARNNPLKYVDPNGMFWQEFGNYLEYGVYTNTNTIAEYERLALTLGQKTGELSFISKDAETYLNRRGMDTVFGKMNSCLLCSNQETLDANAIDPASLSPEALLSNREAIKNNAEAGMGIVMGMSGGLKAIKGAIDAKTGFGIGRFIVDPKGNTMIEPVGGSTIPNPTNPLDTHTLYPNGSNYQRLNPSGHLNYPKLHGHGHLQGVGPGKNGQGASIDINGNVVSSSSKSAHWEIK